MSSLMMAKVRLRLVILNVVGVLSRSMDVLTVGDVSDKLESMSILMHLIA